MRKKEERVSVPYHLLRLLKRLARERPVWLLLLVAILAAAVLALGYLFEEEAPEVSLPLWMEELGTQDTLGQSAALALKEGKTLVWILDVGQGDSILIQTPEKTVLIDAGEREQAGAVCTRLDKMGVRRLDLVIATHPHADHIGAMANVLKRVPAGEALLPELPEALIPTTTVFQNLLAVLEDQSIPVTAARAGQSWDLGGCELHIVGPVREYDNLNDASLVCRLVCGQTAFLFTADMGKLAEQELIESGANLRADVLKAGHHGSADSSSEAFLEATSPSMVAISCGQNNDYGHPHRETLRRLRERGVTVLRTDLQGEILFISDGAEITVQTQREAAQ